MDLVGEAKQGSLRIIADCCQRSNKMLIIQITQYYCFNKNKENDKIKNRKTEMARELATYVGCLVQHLLCCIVWLFQHWSKSPQYVASSLVFLPRDTRCWGPWTSSARLMTTRISPPNPAIADAAWHMFCGGTCRLASRGPRNISYRGLCSRGGVVILAIS